MDTSSPRPGVTEAGGASWLTGSRVSLAHITQGLWHGRAFLSSAYICLPKPFLCNRFLFSKYTLKITRKREEK